MKVLTLTTLYPNAVQPRHGIFVEQRLRALLGHAAIEAQVVAPVPWFPSSARFFGDYATYARVPLRETRHGIAITHPRYPVVPKIGMSLGPLLMALALRPVLGRMLREGHNFDLIDAHYFYPDGVAAALLGRWFRKPVVVTSRGTDLNVIARFSVPGRWIRWAAGRAAGLVTVCEALADVLAELGVPRERVKVLRNGVDLIRFQPTDREQARAELGLSGPLLLSVGNLVPEKGHELAIRALASLEGHSLVIVGEGPEASSLRALAAKLGLQDRVRFQSNVDQTRLISFYSAADALVLASSREGLANVLLESMACGTPVVATAVGGTPEVVRERPAGVLVHERTPEALAEGVRRLLRDPPLRAKTRMYAESFGWDSTTRGLSALFHAALASRLGHAANVAEPSSRGRV